MIQQGYTTNVSTPSNIVVDEEDAIKQSLQGVSTRITEDLSPTMPEIQLWEEYPEPVYIQAPYELSTLPARKREEIERHRKVRRQRLVHANIGA